MYDEIIDERTLTQAELDLLRSDEEADRQSDGADDARNGIVKANQVVKKSAVKKKAKKKTKS